MATLAPKIRCYECDGIMSGQKGAYRYTECGLNSVTLKDIMVYRCATCGSEVPEIPAAGLLHRIIALRLISKSKLLTGGEVRFLRKFCGYSVKEFGEILGSEKSVVCRWEKSGCGKATDRVVRLLVMNKLTRELIGAPPTVLKNVTAEQLLGDLEETLKGIDENRSHSHEGVVISPEEIARFSDANVEVGNKEAVLQ